MSDVKEFVEKVVIDNKEYKVITKESENCLGKDKLVQLILNYALRELRNEDF